MPGPGDDMLYDFEWPCDHSSGGRGSRRLCPDAGARERRERGHPCRRVRRTAQALPFHDPERLVAVWPGRFQSNADLQYLRERAPMFSHLAAVAPGWTMSLTGSGEPVKVTTARVSGNLFETLGVQPAMGRAFSEADARKATTSSSC